MGLTIVPAISVLTKKNTTTYTDAKCCITVASAYVQYNKVNSYPRIRTYVMYFS